jgi:hypothetical protein
MKSFKIYIGYLVLIIQAGFIISLSSCFKDELPEPTQKGEDTLGMLIDGKEWSANTGFDLFGPEKTKARYYTNSQVLIITVRNTTRENSEEIEFFIDKVNTEANYAIDSLNPFFQEPICWESTRFDPTTNDNQSCFQAYYLTKIDSGKVHISTLDTISKIVSGTFEMTLTNFNNETIKITNGRFDLTFQKFKL